MCFKRQLYAVVSYDTGTAKMHFHFVFYLLAWVSQRSFCEDFPCWVQEERALLGIRNLLEENHL